MEEKENKRPENATWSDATEWIGAMLKMQENNTMASETIRDLKKESKSKDLGTWILAISLGGVIAGLIAANFAHTRMFYENDSQWRQTIERVNQKWVDYLSQYDFVTQDGEGVNYYNADIGGDVNNGTTGQETEKQE